MCMHPHIFISVLVLWHSAWHSWKRGYARLALGREAFHIIRSNYRYLVTVSMWPVLGVSGAPLCRLAANIETADTRGTQRGYLAIEDNWGGKANFPAWCISPRNIVPSRNGAQLPGVRVPNLKRILGELIVGRLMKGWFFGGQWTAWSILPPVHFLIICSAPN